MRQREHLFVSDDEREKEEEQQRLEAEGLKDDAEIQRIVALLVPASAGPRRRD